MKSIIFEPSSTHEIAILIKESSFNRGELDNYYVTPLQKLGITRDKCLAVGLPYQNKKAPMKLCMSFLEPLLITLLKIGTKYILCNDAAYFKALTGAKKADPCLGYILPCSHKGYESIKVVYGLNYSSLQYNPAQQPKVDLSLSTLAQDYTGTVPTLGNSVIESAEYPFDPTEIRDLLASLHQYSMLTIDIEAFSLTLQEAYLGSIAFAWDSGNGIAFHIDYTPVEMESGYSGVRVKNQLVRDILRNFLLEYQGTFIGHNVSYDFKVLIYELFMIDPLDTQGMLEGLEILTEKFHDTKVLAYLATNSTAGNKLGLKELSHEYTGNYAEEEIKDIRRISGTDLLKYNLTDCLATWFVFEKMYPIVIQDKQLELYNNFMLPSLRLIIQMELTGMPMSYKKIKEAKKVLVLKANSYIDILNQSMYVRTATHLLRCDAAEKANLKLKKLRKTHQDFKKIVFNHNSGDHIAKVLHTVMDLPIIDLTTTKLPATGNDTLEKLVNHTTDPSKKEVITALLGLGSVSKILSAFIPAFERSFKKTDGKRYLHGCFNLNGTVSGRLSSSKVNLQQIPSNSIYGEIIKSCFIAPTGWLMVGADFASLEDRISALLTKDPNKLKIYTEGFDGHCLRAAYYFNIPVDLTDVKEVNALKDSHSEERQNSKAPTFLLTYGGTHHGLMKNCGFSEKEAKTIEANYHTLYKVSDEYVSKRLAQACIDGYVEVAFGLRVRTPLLAQSILKTDSTMYEAEAESRTAGNALGQSYGMLNNRAAVEFMRRVWQSEYRYDVKPIALIHDAIYLLIRDNIKVLKWVNDNLIECMEWNELPEIQHPTVKLEAELDVFYQGWHQKITLPNKATEEEILAVCAKGIKKILGE